MGLWLSSSGLDYRRPKDAVSARSRAAAAGNALFVPSAKVTRLFPEFHLNSSCFHRCLWVAAAAAALLGCKERGPVNRQAGMPGLKFIDVAGKASAPDPTVVLIHGYGSKADNWLPFIEPLGLRARFVFPEGPEATVPPDGPTGGRAWWRIDLAAFVDITRRGALPDLSRASPPGLALARQRLAAFLDDLIVKPSAQPLVLGGFSQGAMLAAEWALFDPRPLHGLILLSGTFINEAAWRQRLESRRGLRVFISHGRRDDILPFALSEQLAAALRAAGAAVTWLPFDGGHEIPSEVVAALARWLGDLARAR